MTATPPGGDWSDERLASAFSDRAASASAVPRDVEDDVRARLSTVDRGGRRQSWLLAAAVVIAVAVAIGGSSMLGEHQPVPSGSPVAASSGNPPGVEPTNTVLEALGEPVTVAEALSIPDTTQASREIAVQGFLSPVPVIYCALEFRAMNPTRPRCPEEHRWLMEQPEQLFGIVAGSSPAGISLGRPNGPAFHVSFALVKTPVVAWPGEGDAVTPLPVVLIGHFHDRRAELCDAADRQACAEMFIVDRVAVENGEALAPETDRRVEGPTSDLEEDVDALVAGIAPGAIVESRVLLTVNALIGIEPALAKDQVVPYVDPSTLAWLVTTVDVHNGVPVTRTFALLDGSNWFAEITADGATMLERRAPEPSAGVYAAQSTDPAAWVSAPPSVLGIPIGTIGSVMRDRQVTEDDLGRDEFAIGAWYVGPNPSAVCDAQPEMHPPSPPCDQARRWLLGDPRQYGVEQGQLRRDPDLWPSVLNPLLPVDVPFDVGPTWRGDVPLPEPVTVLGHFDDFRVDAFHGNVFFVIDALAWTRDRPAGSIDSVVRLSQNATEDQAGVLARISAASPNTAVATWITVVDATDFELLDPRRAESMSEFTSGAPVWIVRRLVNGELRGRARPAVEWAWTADHGTRVWSTETPDSTPDLATSLDLHDLDQNTTVLQVFDYDRQITSMGPVDGLGQLSWRRLGPVDEIGLDVARGRNPNEVAIRWLGAACDTTWRLGVAGAGEDGIVLTPLRSGACKSERVVRRLLILFDHPVDLDRFRTTDPCCG